MEDWTGEQVGSWLQALGLEEYVEGFRSHDVQGPELLVLQRRDLKELGVVKVGHLKRLLHAIQLLNQ